MHPHRGRATRQKDEKTRREDEKKTEEGWAQAVGHEQFEGP
jgi:hypothetical protein